MEDNGVVFSLEEKRANSKSLGLKTLNERAAMLNADLKINSSEKGTRIELSIPI